MKSASSESATAPMRGASSRTPRSSGRIVETFLIQSLLELRHLRTRVTMADRMIEDQARAFLTRAAESDISGGAQAPPSQAAETSRRKRRSRRKRPRPSNAARRSRVARRSESDRKSRRVNASARFAVPRRARGRSESSAIALRHQTNDLVLGRDAAKAVKRAERARTLRANRSRRAGRPRNRSRSTRSPRSTGARRSRRAPRSLAQSR